jgi:hypothetical protein
MLSRLGRGRGPYAGRWTSTRQYTDDNLVFLVVCFIRSLSIIRDDAES